MSFPNVLVTSYQGFLTKEALEQIAKTTLQNLKDYRDGTQNKNQISAKQVRKE